jgi:class 3 adenylate cyclase
MLEQSFEQIFSSAYSRAKTSSLSKGAEMRESIALDAAAGAKLGHPDFEPLKVGETKESQGVVFFLDIRGFTKMSFVLPNEELLWILQALTQAAIRSVIQFGGHVMEFTGDGIMAVFGDSRIASEAAAFAALHTTAFLMKGVQDSVNPQLERVGTEPVRTAVGMEFGDILWSRIGILDRTQVKPISEATFLAGKLSTGGRAKSWEAMVGANLAGWIPDEFKVQAPKYKFVAHGIEYSRDLFLFRWEQFANDYALRATELRKRLLERKLGPEVQKSPYLTALKLLTDAGYDVFLDESTDCPHLVVEFDRERNLAAIVTFELDSARAVPSLFVREGEQLERVDIDADQWAQGGAKLVSLVAAVRNAWSQQ